MRGEQRSDPGMSVFPEVQDGTTVGRVQPLVGVGWAE